MKYIAVSVTIEELHIIHSLLVCFSAKCLETKVLIFFQAVPVMDLPEKQLVSRTCSLIANVVKVYECGVHIKLTTIHMLSVL